jgi:hypothetical protein
MSKDKESKPVLTMGDFGFLSAGKMKKMEVRFNSNTSEKLYAKASFMIDHERDDTEVGVYVTGKDFPEIMDKLYDWHENYFKNIKVFGKLTGREKDPEKKEPNPFDKEMPFN